MWKHNKLISCNCWAEHNIVICIFEDDIFLRFYWKRFSKKKVEKDWFIFYDSIEINKKDLSLIKKHITQENKKYFNFDNTAYIVKKENDLFLYTNLNKYNKNKNFICEEFWV